MSAENQKLGLLLYDIGPEVGLGHQRRIEALAESFAKQSVKVTTQSLSEISGSRLAQILARGLTQFLVFDSYRVSHKLLREIRLEFPEIPTFIFDDDNLGNSEVHGLFRLLSIERDSNRPWIRAGLRYFPLRKELRSFAKTPKKYDFMICFGGGADEGQTLRALKVLSPTDQKILVVLGPFVKDRETIQKECQRLANIELSIDPPDFVERFASCRNAILSGGVMAIEAAYLKIPSLILPLADHQVSVARLLEDGGFASSLPLYSKVDDRSLATKLNAFIASGNLGLKEKSDLRPDDQGADRLASAVMDYLNEFYRDTYSVSEVRSEYQESSQAKSEFEKVKWGSQEGMLNRFKIAEKVIDWKSIGSWCDIGSGTGSFLEVVEQNHSIQKFVGLDLSENLVRFASQKNFKTTADFKVKSFEERIEDEPFDLVTSLGVLQKSGVGLYRAAALISKKLKRGGQIFITTKNADWTELTSGRLKPEPGHHWFKLDELRWAFERAGITIIEMKGFEPRTASVVEPKASHSVYIYGRKEVGL